MFTSLIQSSYDLAFDKLGGGGDFVDIVEAIDHSASATIDKWTHLVLMTSVLDVGRCMLIMDCSRLDCVCIIAIISVGGKYSFVTISSLFLSYNFFMTDAFDL